MPFGTSTDILLIYNLWELYTQSSGRYCYLQFHVMFTSKMEGMRKTCNPLAFTEHVDYYHSCIKDFCNDCKSQVEPRIELVTRNDRCTDTHAYNYKYISCKWQAGWCCGRTAQGPRVFWWHLGNRCHLPVSDRGHLSLDTRHNPIYRVQWEPALSCLGPT